MANEAVKHILMNSTGDPISYTCAAGTAITKGTLLALTDPMTASAHAAGTNTTTMFAGIAAMDKDNTDDTSTKISAWTNGIFKLYASAAIDVGQPLVLAEAANYVKQSSAGSAGASGAQIIGYALETAAAGETFFARIKI